MIGWWITVLALRPDELNQPQRRQAAVLANWEVGLGGLDWLQGLVEARRALQLSSSGYPNRFTAKADDVLPLLVGGPPSHAGPTVIGDDYVMPSGWKNNVILHPERIEACQADQILTIEAWDMS